MTSILDDLKKRFIAAGKGTGQDIKKVLIDGINLYITLLAYLVATVIIALMVYGITAAGGLAAVLAELMAVACINNPGVPCEFNLLLAGVGLALMITTSVAIAASREIVKLEKINFTDIQSLATIAKYTNAEKDKVYKYIIALGGLDDIRNLKGLGAWLDISYSTLYRYVKEYEADGHITIVSNGSGVPMEIRVK